MSALIPPGPIPRPPDTEPLKNALRAWGGYPPSGIEEDLLDCVLHELSRLIDARIRNRELKLSVTRRRQR